MGLHVSCQGLLNGCSLNVLAKSSAAGLEQCKDVCGTASMMLTHSVSFALFQHKLTASVRAGPRDGRDESGPSQHLRVRQGTKHPET